jgi:hypothetical protein
MHARAAMTTSESKAGNSPPSLTAVSGDRARAAVLMSADYASPLARRVSDLRHACMSTWLNAGVPPAQVAEWVGHSVAVLLNINATCKCIDGQDQIVKRRIQDALGEPEHENPRAKDRQRRHATRDVNQTTLAAGSYE